MSSILKGAVRKSISVDQNAHKEKARTEEAIVEEKKKNVKQGKHDSTLPDLE